LSRISHFQRFSQRENHTTNNTLLLLRYFYESDPFKLQNVLSSILETDLSIGLEFEQQIRGDASIPDALITQEPMRIFIETKRGGELDSEQIRRHLRSIAADSRTSHGDNPILIGLTKESIGELECRALTAEAVKQGIKFAVVTFSQIADALRAQCKEFDRELVSMVEDYDEYLTEEGLSAGRNQWLTVVPCGTSIAENVHFGLYYEPPSRPSKRNYRFIGLYTMKSVTYVGALEAVAVASFGKNGITFTEEAGRLTDDHRRRITAAINETKYYDLKANPHRFYLVDSFKETDARKTSPQGIWGMRRLDLSEMIPDYNPHRKYTTQELAAALRGTTWK
jgi:hypothetical protein